MLSGMGLELHTPTSRAGDETRVRTGASRDQEVLDVQHLTSWSAEVAVVGRASVNGSPAEVGPFNSHL